MQDQRLCMERKNRPGAQGLSILQVRVMEDNNSFAIVLAILQTQNGTACPLTPQGRLWLPLSSMSATSLMGGTSGPDIFRCVN